MNRSSVNKAEWSETREKSYETYCDEILFRRKIQLFFDEHNVYLKTDDGETHLTIIKNPKAIWFEIWLALKDKFGADGIIDKKK